MLIVNRRQMQEVDRISIQKYQISDELLMENAGFEFVHRLLKENELGQRERVAVLCGGGNNGGDGFVIARHLVRRGVTVALYLFVEIGKLTGIALLNFKRLSHYGIEIHHVSQREEFIKAQERLKGYDIYIDALLGIGFHGSPRGVIGEVIEFLNAERTPVFSVDMPSGIDADGGQTSPLAVKATATYTMGCLKYGLVDYPGKAFCGTIRVLDIGFPKAAIDEVKASSSFIQRTLVRRLFPARESDSHKGSYGHLGIIGWKKGYEGAAILASRAACRSGCGLVTLLFPKGVAMRKPDEVISGNLPFDEQDYDPKKVDFESLLSRFNALVIGPGMGIFSSAHEFISQLLCLEKKILIDADGLNNLASNPEILKNAKAEVILTPHIGEMSRLCGVEKGKIKLHKTTIAKEFAEKYNVTLVLKDSVSIVATTDGRLYLNDGGVPALAKGGSGDVLSGIIGSLLARGLGGNEASIIGVFLHTECGRFASTLLHEESVTARDLIEMLPRSFGLLKDEEV